MASETTRGLQLHYGAILGCGIAFTTGAVVTLAMRIMSKAITRIPVCWEDYTIFFATVLFIVTEGLMLKAMSVGRYVKEVNDANDMMATELIFVYSLFYFAIVYFCTTSILLLYRRLFIKPVVRYATTTLLILSTCWWISSSIIEASYLGPPPATWPGKPKNIPGVDRIYLTWWFAAGIIELVLVALTVLVPLREIYLLQLERPKRLAMTFVFAISSLCIATGIARLVTLYHPSDPNFDTSLGDVWISVHLGTAIIGANLPVCWPVFVRLRRYLKMVRNQRHQEFYDAEDPATEQKPHQTHPQNFDSRADTELGESVGAMSFGSAKKQSSFGDEMVTTREFRPDVTRSSSSSSPSSLGDHDTTKSGSRDESAHLAANERSHRPQPKAVHGLGLGLTNWRLSSLRSVFSTQHSAHG